MKLRTLSTLIVSVTLAGIQWQFDEAPVNAAGRDVPVMVTSAPSGLWFTSLSVTDGADLVSAVLRGDINVFVDHGTTRRASTEDRCVELRERLDAPSTYPAIVCADMYANTSGPKDMRGMTVGMVHHKRFQVSWSAPAGMHRLRFGSGAFASAYLERLVVIVTADLARATSLPPHSPRI